MGDVTSIAGEHRGGTDNGYGGDCTVHDVGRARVSEELTDSVCGVLVQSGDITATEQATKLGLPG